MANTKKENDAELLGAEESKLGATLSTIFAFATPAGTSYFNAASFSTSAVILPQGGITNPTWYTVQITQGGNVTTYIQPTFALAASTIASFWAAYVAVAGNNRATNYTAGSAVCLTQSGGSFSYSSYNTYIPLNTGTGTAPAVGSSAYLNMSNIASNQTLFQPVKPGQGNLTTSYLNSTGISSVALNPITGVWEAWLCNTCIGTYATQALAVTALAALLPTN
jgi:hypothetical protein